MAKISDLLHMSYSDFENEQKLRRAVSTLADAANKRIRRLQERHINSRALKRAMASGGKFSTRGKGIVELQDEFMRVREFLQSPSSSVQGIVRERAKAVRALKKAGITIDPKKYDEVMDTYEQLRLENPEVTERQLYYEVLKAISQYSEDKYTKDDVYEKVKVSLKDMYEKEQEREYDYATSNFFRMDGQ